MRRHTAFHHILTKVIGACIFFSMYFSHFYFSLGELSDSFRIVHNFCKWFLWSYYDTHCHSQGLVLFKVVTIKGNQCRQSQWELHQLLWLSVSCTVCHVLNLGVDEHPIWCRSLAHHVSIRSLAVGTKTGYRLFSVTSVDKLDCIHESGESIPIRVPAHADPVHQIRPSYSTRTEYNRNSTVSEKWISHSQIPSRFFLTHAINQLISPIASMASDWNHEVKS